METGTIKHESKGRRNLKSKILRRFSNLTEFFLVYVEQNHCSLCHA